jgi:ELWxxDGT repeat protein
LQRLFFAATDGTHGVELWKSNGTGTGTGTVMVKDINPGKYSSYPTYLTNVDGALLSSDPGAVPGGALAGLGASEPAGASTGDPSMLAADTTRPLASASVSKDPALLFGGGGIGPVGAAPPFPLARMAAQQGDDGQGIFPTPEEEPLMGDMPDLRQAHPGLAWGHRKTPLTAARSHLSAAR